MPPTKRGGKKGGKRKTISLSRHRRQRQKTEPKEHIVVAKDNDDVVYYEVEKVVGVRKRKSKREYLVRWKGVDPSGDTWEPPSNLCDTALQAAQQFLRAEKKERMAKEAEAKAALLSPEADTRSKVIEPEMVVGDSKELQAVPPAPVDGIPLDKMGEEAMGNSASLGQDISLVKFQAVERIPVTAQDAGERVANARVHGIPVVLTGQKGWPQFATRWLKTAKEGEPLDLSQPHELDIDSMIEDIGDEWVPLLKKNYDETDPIQRHAQASVFLRECWPVGETPSARKNLYLHQWQFPRSDTAATKLCGEGKCTSLPNDIFLEDMLQYWLDRKTNPFQYIFMGDVGTRSKLHKDNGGLEITIAPIVGKKECILAHRLDGDRCLYGLQSKLDKIDLNKFPLTAFARVWKTVVEPGEILIMPHNTYHQCRNVTPCLSYHRFHLDSINTQAFLESMVAGDAPEIDHDEVFWNSATEFMCRVDGYVEQVRAGPPEVSVPDEIEKTVDALRLLRQVSAEIARLLKSSVTDSRMPRNSVFRKMATDLDSHCWPRMVQDIDCTLHEYHFRNTLNPPKFRIRQLGRVSSTNESQDDTDDLLDPSTMKDAPKDLKHVTAKSLEQEIQALPLLQPFQRGLVISDSIALPPGEAVAVRVGDRVARGTIERVVDEMRAAFVVYEELPDYLHEYHPLDVLRHTKEAPGSGEPSDSIISEATGEDGSRIKTVAYCPLAGNEDEVRITRECHANNACYSFSPLPTARKGCRPVYQVRNILFASFARAEE